jgi:hypothetical protein
MGERCLWVVVAALALLSPCCEGPRQAREATPVAAAGRRPEYRSFTGTLVGYDARARVLTLRAADGVTSYWVAEDARAWLGSSRMPVAQLGSHLGAEVTLAFAETEDGVRTTHTVRLREASHAR